MSQHVGIDLLRNHIVIEHAGRTVAIRSR